MLGIIISLFILAVFGYIFLSVIMPIVRWLFPSDIDRQLKKATAELKEAKAISPYLMAKKCPHCAENIKCEAIKCRHCGFEFDVEEVANDLKYRRVAVAALAQETGMNLVQRFDAQTGFHETHLPWHLPTTAPQKTNAYDAQTGFREAVESGDLGLIEPVLKLSADADTRGASGSAVGAGSNAPSTHAKDLTVTYACPHCGEILVIPEAYLGKEGRCNRCKEKFTVLPEYTLSCRRDDAEDLDNLKPSPLTTKWQPSHSQQKASPSNGVRILLAVAAISAVLLIVLCIVLNGPREEASTEQATTPSNESSQRVDKTINWLYSPSRPPATAWKTGEDSFYPSLGDAIRALAKQYNRDCDWVEKNMGESNDLAVIHSSLTKALRSGEKNGSDNPMQTVDLNGSETDKMRSLIGQKLSQDGDRGKREIEDHLSTPGELSEIERQACRAYAEQNGVSIAQAEAWMREGKRGISEMDPVSRSQFFSESSSSVNQLDQFDKDMRTLDGLDEDSARLIERMHNATPQDLPAIESDSKRIARGYWDQMSPRARSIMLESMTPSERERYKALLR